MGKLIDMYGVMQNVPKITGLDLEWKKDSWEGKYYLNGEPHPYKKDKLKVKFWEHGKGCSIWLHEQGGESMSLQNWLQRYGGAADWKEAMDMMRCKSNVNKELLDVIRSEERKKECMYISKGKYEACSMYELERCPLFLWMCRLFGERKVREVWKRYHVTTDGRGLAVFWYTDSEGRICYDKRMRYRHDGHRDKTFGGTRTYKTDMGYTARPMFGEHMIKDGMEINVLESEKSVLVAACRYPDKLFVGTGGKNNIRSVDGNMVLYPDMDAISEWSAKGARICEWWMDDCEVGEHDDFADSIVRGMRRNL